MAQAQVVGLLAAFVDSDFAVDVSLGVEDLAPDSGLVLELASEAEELSALEVLFAAGESPDLAAGEPLLP